MNTAVVGCGVWGMNYVRVFSELSNARVVAVCDESAERLALVQGRFAAIKTFRALAELLDEADVDAVAIATPATTHFQAASECLKRGKHVLVEKPLTMTTQDGNALIELAATQKRILMVGHTFLYNPGIRKVRDLIAQNSIGTVYYLHSTRTNLGPIRQDVNAVWDLAPHDVSLFNYLLEKEPRWVSVTGACVLGNAREDVAFITLAYPDNIIGNIHVSWADPNKVRELVVVGSQRRIVFDDLNLLERVRVFEKGVDVQREANSYGEFKLLIRDGDIFSPHVPPSEPLKEQCAHFVECVTQGKHPLTDGRNGVAVVRVMQAIDRSLAQNGAPVEIEEQ